MQTERVTFLTSREHKAALDAFASERGESVGNVVREATARFIGAPTAEEEAELAALVEQVNEAVPKMRASIDRITDRLEAMHLKNQKFLKQMGIEV